MAGAHPRDVLIEVMFADLPCIPHLTGCDLLVGMHVAPQPGTGDPRLPYGVPGRDYSRPFVQAVPHCGQHHAGGDVEAGPCIPAEPTSTSLRTVIPPLVDSDTLHGLTKSFLCAMASQRYRCARQAMNSRGPDVSGYMDRSTAHIW